MLPEPSKSSGVPDVRQESLSRTPHTVMPVQRETARQALDDGGVDVGLVAEPCDVELGDLHVDAEVGEALQVGLVVAGTGMPVPRWDWKPTQSIGTPRDLKSRTML